MAETRISSHKEHILGSTVAGVTSTILGHPLDTIKTHLQTNPKLHNSFQILRKVNFGVFRGMGPPLINAVAMNTVMFSVFDQVHEKVGDPFIAGVLSGFATAMISTPTDYVKIHAQISRRDSWSIIRATSPFMLYRGHISNLGREGVFTMVYLGLYHHWMLHDEEQKKIMTVAVTSSLTGALAWIASYPLDTVKTLIQSGRSTNEVVSLLKNHGLSHFYKGCGASTGRAMLVTSSRMIAYESILEMMCKNREG